MWKLFLCLLTGLWVCTIACPVLADSVKSSNIIPVDSITTTTQEKTKLKKWVTIQCGNPVSLSFSGSPNESQTGEVSYTINTNLGCKSMVVEISGSALANDYSSLDTEYQPDNDRLWYKADESFQVFVVPGKTNSIKFRATTGAKISAQHAGAYSAKLSFLVISIK